MNNFILGFLLTMLWGLLRYRLPQGYYRSWRWITVSLSFPHFTRHLYVGALVACPSSDRKISFSVDAWVISASIGFGKEDVSTF